MYCANIVYLIIQIMNYHAIYYISRFRVCKNLIASVPLRLLRCWLGQSDAKTAWCTSAMIRIVVKETTAVYVLQTELSFLYWKFDIILYLLSSIHRFIICIASPLSTLSLYFAKIRREESSPKIKNL